MSLDKISNQTPPASFVAAQDVRHEDTTQVQGTSLIAQVAVETLKQAAVPSESTKATAEVNDFSSWTYTVAEIPTFCERLQQPGKNKKTGAKDLGVEMKMSSKAYRALHPRSTEQSSLPQYKGDVHRLYPAYDDIRVLRDRPELGYVNASYVKTPDQNFILACCPQTEREAAAMFFALFKDPSDKQVWVSLHALTDGMKKGKEKRLCNDFTSDEILSKLHIPDGWKISKVERMPKIMGTIPVSKEDGSSAVPYVTEVKITATNGERIKEIVCLRYHEWEDHHVVPDENLFLQLFDRTQELCPNPKTDIMVNCVGGVGRTGMFAILYSLWNKIKQEAATSPIEKIPFNIPQMTLEMRKDRMCLLDNLSHLAPMARILQQLAARQKTDSSHS